MNITDLQNSGIVGLIDALEKYDPSRGAFTVYAKYRIIGEIMDHLRSLDWVNRSVRAWGRKLEAARNSLTGLLGMEPTPDEMAAELEVTVKKYYKIEQKLSEARMLSIDDLSIDSEEVWKEAQEKLSSYSFNDPLTLVEGKDFVEKSASAIEKLPEQERLVVTLYYHNELTLRQIGEILELTEGRISQINGDAIKNLRISLGVNGLH